MVPTGRTTTTSSSGSSSVICKSRSTVTSILYLPQTDRERGRITWWHQHHTTGFLHHLHDHTHTRTAYSHTVISSPLHVYSAVIASPQAHAKTQSSVPNNAATAGIPYSAHYYFTFVSSFQTLPSSPLLPSYPRLLLYTLLPAIAPPLATGYAFNIYTPWITDNNYTR